MMQHLLHSVLEYHLPTDLPASAVVFRCWMFASLGAASGDLERLLTGLYALTSELAVQVNSNKQQCSALVVGIAVVYAASGLHSADTSATNLPSYWLRAVRIVCTSLLDRLRAGVPDLPHCIEAAAELLRPSPTDDQSSAIGFMCQLVQRLLQEQQQSADLMELEDQPSESDADESAGYLHLVALLASAVVPTECLKQVIDVHVWPNGESPQGSLRALRITRTCVVSAG